jgi:hypothetical protein
MTDTTLFTIYWLTAPIVLGGLGLLVAWLFVRHDRRHRMGKP